MTYSILGETTFQIKDVVNILHEVFADRASNGMNFWCATISEDEFIQDTKDGVIFVAIDEEKNRLVGTGTLKIKKYKKMYMGICVIWLC